MYEYYIYYAHSYIYIGIDVYIQIYIDSLVETVVKISIYLLHEKITHQNYIGQLFLSRSAKGYIHVQYAYILNVYQYPFALCDKKSYPCNFDVQNFHILDIQYFNKSSIGSTPQLHVSNIYDIFIYTYKCMLYIITTVTRTGKENPRPSLCRDCR